MARGLPHRLLHGAVPLLALLVTLMTGFLVSNGTSYGFPIPWRTQIQLCPLPRLRTYLLDILNAKCLVNTNYNFLYLFMDAVFYAGLGYAGFLARAGFKKSAPGLRRFLMQLVVRWEGLARPFRVSAALGVLAGGYLVYRLPPWLIIQSWSWTVAASDGGLYPMLLWTVYIPLYFMISVIPAAGAICLVAVRMSDEKRGILALFVTVYSFVPVVFLGFQLFYWILLLWPIMIIALVWTTLLAIATRILHSGESRRL